MDNYILLPEEKKTLKAMRGKTSVPQEDIYNWKSLYQNGFIQQNYLDKRDSMNAPIHDGTYRLSDNYWRYIESNRWFNIRYVITSIIVPILVGVLSAVVTRFLLGS